MRRINLIVAFLMIFLFINHLSAQTNSNSQSYEYGKGKWSFAFSGLVNKPSLKESNKEIKDFGLLLSQQLGTNVKLEEWGLTGDISTLLGYDVTPKVNVFIALDWGSGSVGNNLNYSQLNFNIPGLGTVSSNANVHFKQTYTDWVLSLGGRYNIRPGKRINPYIQANITYHWFDAITDVNVGVTQLNQRRDVHSTMNETAFGFTPSVGVDIYITNNFYIYFMPAYPVATIKGPAKVNDVTSSPLGTQNNIYSQNSKIETTGPGLYFGIGRKF